MFLNCLNGTEIRPAPYMENVVTVYKKLCATSLSQIFHPISAGKIILNPCTIL